MRPRGEADEAKSTSEASSSLVKIRQTDLGKGRLVLVVSQDTEPDQSIRIVRMNETYALAEFLYDKLCSGGFWRRGTELVVTLGPPLHEPSFATPLPGYSSKWNSKQFEDAACLAARRFVRAIAPSAPVNRYLAEFNRLGRTYRWSHEAKSSRLAARLDLSLTRERFESSLTVTGPEGATTFPVLQSEPNANNWIVLFERLSVTNRRVTITAETGQWVRVVRTGRPFVSYTGRGRDRQRFIVDVGPSGAKVLREFDLKRFTMKQYIASRSIVVPG